MQVVRRLMGMPGIAITAVPADQSPIKKNSGSPFMRSPPSCSTASPTVNYEEQLITVKTRLLQHGTDSMCQVFYTPVFRKQR